MRSLSIVAMIFFLALASMACAISVNVPVQDFRTGPTQTLPINIDAPASDTANLTLDFGAGELTLTPGAASGLVVGVATYNIEQLKPEITVNGSDIRLSTGNLEVRGFPSIRTDNFKNTWELQLSSQPVNLKLNAGAYQGKLELGGLSLRNLEINDGAADVDLSFSQPNQVAMDNLLYTTGASDVRLLGLANANFSQLTFRSGAGNYTLDFSGSLQRDANVLIESGLSQVTVIVPAGVQAQVSLDGGLSNIELHDAWERLGSNNFALKGSGPRLLISIKMGAGNLVFRNP